MKFKSRFVIRSFIATAISVFIFDRSIALETPNCATPKNANDILKCLQQRHPEVQSEDIINEVSEKIANQGSSWKNPEVIFDTTQGNNLGRKIVESEVRLSQAIEVTGQRSARKNQGKALGLSFKAESLGKLEEVTINGIKSLYRLTQLKEEVEVVDESVKRFRVIKKQYQSRPRLNPEQEVTSGIIQLAVSEYEIKLNRLSSERKEILSELLSSSGLTSAQIEKNLPAIKTDWPEIPKALAGVKSSDVLKSQAQVDLALSNFEEAKSMAWPEFTLSLIAQDRIDGSLQYQMYGLGVSMPFPIFQRNEGEKSLKASEYSKAFKVHNTNLKKIDSHSQNLKLAYENSVLSLKNTPSSQSIESKHKRIESLFSQGLVSGPVFIEAHKQRVDYLESRNQEELQALEALWSLYILNGTFVEQKL